MDVLWELDTGLQWKLLTKDKKLLHRCRARLSHRLYIVETPLTKNSFSRLWGRFANIESSRFEFPEIHRVIIGVLSATLQTCFITAVYGENAFCASVKFCMCLKADTKTQLVPTSARPSPVCHISDPIPIFLPYFFSFTVSHCIDLALSPSVFPLGITYILATWHVVDSVRETRREISW